MANAVGNQKPPKFKFPIRIAVIYVLLGTLWILFSDRLLGMVAVNSTHFVQISMAKGILFVLYSALVLYLLLRQELKEVTQSQTALQLSERRFRAMFEMASVGMAQTDPTTGRWQHVNQKFTEITGYAIDELVGRRFYEITHPEDRERDWQAYQEMVRGEQPDYRNEKRYIRKNGTIVWVNINVNMVYDEAGRPLHSLAVVEDITKRKQVEEALRESEQRVRVKLDQILSPEGELKNLELTDIMDAPAIQSLLDDFYELAHFPACIVDLNGKILAGVGWQDICAKFHRNHPETCRYCMESDTQLTKGVPPGEVKLYKCKNNMWDIATPLIVGGQHLGNLFSGQFFFDDETLDYELFRLQARKYGFDEQEYLTALELVPRFSKGFVDAGMAFLVKLSNMISLLSYSNIKLARSLSERGRLADSLRESQERLNVALAASHMGVWEWNIRTDAVFWSPECYKIFGAEHLANVRLTTQDYKRFVHPEDLEPIRAIARQAVSEKRVYSVDFRIIRPNGEVRWAATLGQAEYDENGQPIRIVGTLMDITARKEAEEALEAEAIRRRILVEQSRDGIVVLDETGKVFEANQEFARMLGYSDEEVDDLYVWDWDAQWNREELEEIIRVVGVAGDHFETRHRRKDGSVFDVEISSNAVVLAGRKLIFCVCRDISRRKAAEELLRQSETKFRELFENMSSAVAIYRAVGEGEDFVFLEINRALERIDQVKREAVIGKKVGEIFPAIRDFGLFEVLQRVGRTGIPEAFPVKWYQDERLGGWREHYVFRLPGGEVAAVYDDVTERVRAEEALFQNNLELQEIAQELQKSKNMLQLILESIPVRVFWKDNELRFLGCNTAFARDAGFSQPKELLGKDDFAMGWRDQAERYRADDRRVIESRRSSMNMLEPQTTPTGGTVWLTTSKVPLQMPDGEVLGILGVYADITERKQAEDALAQQSQFLQLLIDTIPIPIFYKDEQGRYLDCNQAFQSFFGVSKAKIVGKSMDGLGLEHEDEYRQKDEELFRHPGVKSYEAQEPRGDGSRRDLLVNKATFMKADGTVGGLIGVLNDITEIKEAEKQLRALATRMAEVEEEERQALARELHDQVCQNLAILGLTLESLKMRAYKEPLDRLLSRIGEISTLVEQTGEITREVMEGLRPTTLDHYGLLEGLRRWGKQFSQRTGISVEVLGDEAEPRLAGAAELALFRIAQEALNNVAKHAQASRVVLTEVVDQHTVRLDIVDNGIGFEPNQARMPEGRHQWGLITMSERAMAVGGECRIQSKPGAGTRVLVEVSR